MHTRCCDELIKLQGGFIADSKSMDHSLVLNTMGIESVPAIVEFRATPSAAPAAGNLFFFTQLWDGGKVRNGNLKIAVSGTDIATCFNNGFDVGIVIEFPNGIGRGFGLYNDTLITFSDVFISIRRMVTVTIPESEAK